MDGHGPGACPWATSPRILSLFKLQGAALKLLLLPHHLFPLKLWSLAVKSAVIGLTWTRHLPLAEGTMHSIISPTFSQDSPAFAAPTSSPARKAVVRCNVNDHERSLFAGMLNLRNQAIMQTVHMPCHLPDVKILYSLLTLLCSPLGMLTTACTCLNHRHVNRSARQSQPPNLMHLNI